jgi:hypothetical protein
MKRKMETILCLTLSLTFLQYYIALLHELHLRGCLDALREQDWIR